MSGGKPETRNQKPEKGTRSVYFLDYRSSFWFPVSGFWLSVRSRVTETSRSLLQHSPFVLRPSSFTFLLSAFCLLLSSPLFAHGAEHHLETANVATWWTFDPLVVFGVAVSAILYVLGLREMRARGATRRALPRWQVASFFAGLGTIALALVSPLDQLSDIVFSAHMAQHEMLMLLAAPLLVLGRPLVVFLMAFRGGARAKLAGLARSEAVLRAWRLITGPIFVWTLHGLALWIWHLPSLYEAALLNDGVHAVQHLCFLGSALLFWWSLVYGRYGRLGYGAGVMYVFTTMLHSSILGVLLTFAPRVWYPLYGTRAEEWGLNALEDQQLAGLVMWVAAGTVFVVIGLALFAAWIGESDRRVMLGRTESLTAGERHVR